METIGTKENNKQTGKENKGDKEMEKTTGTAAGTPAAKNQTEMTKKAPAGDGAKAGKYGKFGGKGNYGSNYRKSSDP